MTSLGIHSAPIDTNRALARHGLDAYPSGAGEVLAATAEEAWVRNPATSLARELGRWQAPPPDDASAAFVTGLDALPAPPPLLAPEAANREFGIDGHLSFDAAIAEPHARELYELKRDELRRQSVLERSPGGLALGGAQLLTGFGVSALDPLNVASAFVPVVGPARYALWLERAASHGGRAAIRAGVGAAEGLAGAALLEPLVYGVAQREQADYGAVDSLLNLGFGTVLGGGLHVAGGAVGDALSGWKPPVQALAEAASPEAREAAMRGSVAAVAEDMPVRGVDVVLGEQQRLGEAYDGVLTAPRGPADDPTVALQVTDIERLLVERGPVVERDGEIVVSGKGRAAYGLVKIIWRHGEMSNKGPDTQVTREDIVALPDIVRDLAPQPGTSPGSRAWLVERQGRKVAYVDAPVAGEANVTRLVTVFVVDPRSEWAAWPLSARRAGASESPSAAGYRSQDTGRGLSIGNTGGRTAPARTSIGRGAGIFNKPQPIFDADGRRLMARYEVVELDELVASHTDDLAINPAFPGELQPRERDRAAAAAQIADIAANLEPERLGISLDAATGAPIVDSGGIVESGNGRVLALSRAYAEQPAAARRYQAYLASLGFDVAGLRRPVLVRRRLSELDGAERRAFTVAAQKSAVLDLSETERALADARLVDPLLHLYEGGEPGQARNRRFVQAFVGRLPQADQGGLASADGSLSQAGARRIRNALLARAFDDAELLGRMIETDDDHSRALAGALLDVAPAWARMRAAAASGEIAPGVDATPDLLAAVRAVRDARAAGRPLAEVLTQLDAFDRRSPATDLFLGAMLRVDGEGRARTASRESIGEALARYVGEAMKTTAGADMFGTPPPRADELLRALAGRSPDAARFDPAELHQVAALDDTLAELEVPARAEHDDAALDAEVARAREAGLLAGDEPELAEAAALAEAAEGEARGYEAAAFCLGRRA